LKNCRKRFAISSSSPSFRRRVRIVEPDRLRFGDLAIWRFWTEIQIEIARS